MKLMDSVYMVGSGTAGFSMTNAFDCTVYLVDGKDELALIDAGVGVQPERILKQIERDGFAPAQIGKILLTHGHGDHAGGAYALSKACGATVYALEPAAEFIRKGDIHALSLEPAIEAGVYEAGYRFMPCAVEPLEPNQEIRVGQVTLKVIPTEGHSAGHCSYWGEIDEKTVLFAGDAIQCDGKIALQAIWDCDLQRYVETIHRLNTLKPDVLLPAHGRFALENGALPIQKAEDKLKTLALPPNSIE